MMGKQLFKPDALIDQLASVHFVLTRTLEIERPSQVLRKHMPELRAVDAEQVTLASVFKVIRPNTGIDYDTLSAASGVMVLMVAHSQGFAIRGQFVVDEQHRLHFVGAPWLAWMNQNHPDKMLPISDFKAWDPQLDQLVLLSTERQNIQDLEQLAKQLKQAKEEADAARHAQADFFAIMSHEMRTPLTGVVSALELIDATEFTGRARRMLEIANMAAKNLRAVVNQVLDYSKLQAGGFNNQRASFDVKKLSQSVVRVLEAKAAHKGLKIDLLISQELPAYLVADAAKIRQVTLNLLSNALKFTEQGKVELRVSLAKGDTGEPRLSVQVQDTGKGIAPHLHDQIFKPFLTYDATKGDAESGTGLGLTIAARMVEIMGGSIGFETTPGRGSCFRFELPVEVADTAADTLDLEEEAGIKCFEGRVLLVEDNEVNQYLGQLMLEDRGLEVVLANNGQEAVDKISRQIFDLVFMDVSMPVMDGLTATKIVRERKLAADIPIIAMTAHVGDDMQKEFMASGMNGVLHKPVDATLLEECLSQWLRGVEVAPPPAPCNGDAAAAPILDASRVDRLISDIGVQGYERYCQLLSEDLTKGVQEIVAAQAASDYALVGKIAHRLKGSSATVGLMELVRVTRHLELNAPKAKERAPIDAMIKDLGALCEDSLHALGKLDIN
ncbi:ATP-binding protein [Simiduia sp. 21SJ11W-1]|uniref:ATP-binding protein n=1 Tax=Simiduia sp. 21SJ11W-1 TaxID=2909669 RepID=UPI00209D8445|nr:ATP-binding protein [Simiduia sp. 21SJ11W-1]UTA48090.1 ATP-binding protein [Simiduia sp. 21SJ11W-1]